MLFKENNFLKYLSNKINYDISNLNLITCIVNGNRMFSGWKEKNHSVRCVHEMCNYIDTGIISVGIIETNESKDIKEFRLWKGECFSPEDLVDYIENDKVHNPLFNALVQYWNITKVRGKQILLLSYAIDQNLLIDEYSKTFKINS